MKIRAALPNEAPYLVRHVLLSHSEVGHGGFNPVKVHAEIEGLIRDCLVLVASKDRELVGSIGLRQTDYWYNDDAMITDVWLYVMPEHRGFGTALKLLTEAKTAARLTGLPFYPAMTPRKNTEKLIRFYGIAGFKPFGLWFEEAGSR